MRFYFLIGIIFFSFAIQAQNFKFPQQSSFNWSDKNVDFDNIPDSLLSEDAVILKDEVYYNQEYFVRRVSYKIQNEKAIENLKQINIPENFDVTNYPNVNKQGRFKDQKAPNYRQFNVMYLAFRVIRNGVIMEVPVKLNVNTLFWVKNDGSHSKADIYSCNISSLKVGDILEYTYKAEMRFSQIIFYLNTAYHRLNLNIQTGNPFSYFISNLADSMLFKPKVKDSGLNNFNFKNLKPVRYCENIIPGKNLTHIIFYNRIMPWMFLTDSVTRKKYNTKEQGYFKKFSETIVKEKTDTFGLKFAETLVDTINNLKFISAESMYYSQNAQYAITSAEHLYKGRLVEEFMYKTYDRIFEDKELFFYMGILADKRKNELRDAYYSHGMYNEVVAVLPTRKSMVFLRVREGGVKYYLNELPFYLENTRCVLAPMNVQFSGNKQSALKVGFVTTPKSNFNINIRSETGTFTIDHDSMKIHAVIKESLNGQFSTILRHYYNKDFIDSTITPNYFKKCSDKPGSHSVSLSRTNNAKIFPFKQSYVSDFSMPLRKVNEIDLKDWFSFFWTKNTFAKDLTNDYYVDFQYTDIYNYLFDFKYNVEILNLEMFNKKLSNEFFEVSSNLVKQNEHSYLFSLSVKCKKDIIPYQNRSLLFEIVSIMDQINNLKLQYKTL